jgi:hypothetical protein
MKLTKSRRSTRAAYIATIIVAAGVAASTVNAESRRVQIGTLTCSLSSSIGLVIGSQRNVSCMFRGVPGEPDEPYTGTMTRVGLDVGLTTGSIIIWTVFADTSRHKGMLTGTTRCGTPNCRRRGSRTSGAINTHRLFEQKQVLSHVQRVWPTPGWDKSQRRGQPPVSLVSEVSEFLLS